MISRRSTRLASKAKSAGTQDDVTADSQHGLGSARSGSRILRTPLNRSGQKRKRGPCTATSADDDGNSETGMVASAELHTPADAVGGTPKILTQNRVMSSSRRLSLNGSAAFSPLSLENDSFMLALDQMENNEKMTESEPVNSQCETVCDNCSQDVFGDDADILAALPPTPDNNHRTPKRSFKGHIPQKKLSDERSAGSKMIAVNSTNDFQTAKSLLELEKSLEAKRQQKPKRGRKRSTTAGEKNNVGVQGKGTKNKKKKTKFKLAFTNRKAVRELANSASNELSKEDLSYMTEDEKLQLASWGLPNSVLKNYRSKGITSLFKWQLDCLANEKVLEGRNLLYSAPTSAGKTLVSEILMIKRVLELGRKAIMILPFVSVAREKVYSLQNIFGDAGIRVEGFMGSVNPPGGFKAVDIAICTIEKANSLLNKLLEENALADLGTLVVDELHLIGDPHRGYLLELLLTKILYMTSIKNNNVENSLNMSEVASKRFNIQVIGMSATLPNLNVLAEWLNAELYVTDFRPVPLMERLKVENKLLDQSLTLVRDVHTEDIPIHIDGDTDHIVYLTLETVLAGFSVLIFCSTKAKVEQTAKRITENFYRIGDPTNNHYPEIGERLRNCLNGSRIKAVLDQLRQCPGGADEVLSKTIMFGIGYHHAGLTYENRDIVESAFKRGVLKVIVATSTLSAGVNLPARRVLISSPVIYNGNILDTMTYRQMCGRAGRNGIDTEGESILICSTSEQEKGLKLFQGQMPIVKSALLGDGSLTSSVKRALLEAIASGIASLTTDIRAFSRCTFLFHSLDAGLYERAELSLSQMHKETTIEECVKYLEQQDFIRIKHFEQDDKPDEYMPTQLGSACLAASLSPDDGVIVYKELVKARECFVLENELHVIYQVTPIYVSDQLNRICWPSYLKIWENLDVSEKKVAALIGIKELFIFKSMTMGINLSSSSKREELAIHQRFFAALALSDLVNEKSLEFVGNKYQLSKGVLQNLQQAASTFAGMVTAFCGRLGWSNLELLLSQFQERLEFGVQRELCDLVRLDCLNGQRARILYDAGLKNIMELAIADPAQVEHVLHKATPFKSNVHGGRESSIWMIGKESLTEAEAAQKIVQEARTFVQIELGQQGNIMFAFGNNDAAGASVSKPLGHEHNASGRSDMALNNSKDEQKSGSSSEIESTSVQKMLQPSLKSVEGGGESHEGHIAQEGVPEILKKDVNRDIELEEFFSQRQQDIESSIPVPIEGANQSDQCIFEDSFPEIPTTELSALYSNKYHQAGKDEVDTKFSMMQEVDRVAVVKPQINTIEDKARISRVQCDGGNFNQNPIDLQHSTPLITGAPKRHHRFTLQQNEQASPVRAVSPTTEADPDLTVNNEVNGNASDEHRGELSQRILAEFDKDFSSFLESSVELNGERNDDLNENIGMNEGNGENVGLSDSVAEAMQALAEDTNFDSEELFQEDKVVTVETSMPQNPVSHSPIPENGRYNGLEEEDFILTQTSWVSEEQADKEENDLFEESCSETESSSAWTESSDFQPSQVGSSNSAAEMVIHETMVGKVKLTTKIVKSVDMIPASFFKDNELVGLGLKLVSQKKPSASIARQGIGARVISKTANLDNVTLPIGETHHSLAMYNGNGVIWVLKWENENGLRVGGSRKNTTGNSKLEEVLGQMKIACCAVAIFDSKEKIKNLLKCCGASVLSMLPKGEKMWDPRIAQWMWDFDDEDWNVSKRKLIDEYVTEEERSISNSKLDKETIEAFFVWKVMSALKEKLLSTGLWNHYITTEMPSVVPLLLMEMNGFGLDSIQLGKLKRVLQFKSALLELRAFQLAGRQFNLASPKDIKQILFREIGLKQPKGKGTGKDVLLKLDHELPGVIVEWRKVTSALQKVVIPFQQERNLETGRVHGYYSHFTVTGRVVMSEPSLQCIPRDFDIQIAYDSKEISEIKNNIKIKFGSKLTALLQQLDSNAVDAYVLNNISLISMRNAFIPYSDDFTILTADYSQLELRILAHLSGDVKLLEALNKDTDVFTEIASQWKKLPQSKITNSIRQEAKGIVYGVIYGMSARTLAEQMEIEEREASYFITQFMRTYPGISAFIEKAHKLCQEKGYVETMTGRRRYLPLINSRNPHEKAKAIRQAVNTQIQGSAADLVKAAMTRIHAFLQSTYPTSAIPIEWNKLLKARRSSISFQSPSISLDNLVFFPILNLHDELIFEVRKTHLEQVVKAVKREMESCIKLDVKLPVVIKIGDSWGSVKVYGGE